MKPAHLFAISICLAALTGCEKQEAPSPAPPSRPPDPARGKEAIAHYQCIACHEIPGVEGPRGGAGPSLAHFASHPTIAGTAQNTHANLARWITDPHSVKPATPMPSLNVSAQDAEDIASYLETLK